MFSVRGRFPEEKLTRLFESHSIKVGEYPATYEKSEVSWFKNS